MFIEILLKCRLDVINPSASATWEDNELSGGKYLAYLITGNGEDSGVPATYGNIKWTAVKSN